ncbi:hypothetical protein ACHAW5_006684, partial [Stephanodiscus triporus]
SSSEKKVAWHDDVEIRRRATSHFALRTILVRTVRHILLCLNSGDEFLSDMLIETIDNDDAAPAPFNSMEFDSYNEETRAATAATGAMQLETTTDDNNAAPAPFNSMEFDAGREETGAETAVAGAMLLETIDDDAAPAPFSSMEFEEHGAAPSKPNAMQRTNTVNEDSILVAVQWGWIATL